MSDATEVIFESLFDEGVSLDRESNVIVGVRLSGRVSKNGYTFSEGSYRDAKNLYDGLPVYLGHDRNLKYPTERPLDQIAGIVRNPRIDNEGLPRGDIHTADAPQGETLRKLVRSGLRDIGLSHVAAYTFRASDRTVVESVDHVYSVDLVRSPATTKSLYESDNSEQEEGVMIEELRNEIADLKALVESLREELKKGSNRRESSHTQGNSQGPKERTEVRREPFDVHKALDAEFGPGSPAHAQESDAPGNIRYFAGCNHYRGAYLG